MSRSRTGAIVLVYSRPSDFTREEDWSQWYDDPHVPATAAAGGAWVVTRWEVIDRPPGGTSPVGFSHVAIYELETLDGVPAVLARLDGPRTNGGAIHPVHTVVDVDVLTPIGRWSRKDEPSSSLTGHVLAYVGPNDPARLDEWNSWYDAVHVVDMMESGAFANTSRWVRVEPRRWGPNHLTLYDVHLPDVAEAVTLSGRAMAPAKAAGRILDCHMGGLRAALRPAGRYGSSGYRPVQA